MKFILLTICLAGCVEDYTPGVPGEAFRPLRAGRALTVVQQAKVFQMVDVSPAPVEKFSTDFVYSDVGDYITTPYPDAPSGKGMVLEYMYADYVYLTVDEHGKGAIQQGFFLGASVHTGTVETEEEDQPPFVGETTSAGGNAPDFLPRSSVERLKDDYSSWKESL